MKTNQSFSIDFIIRKCKADKKRADIFARITVDGEPKELSIKEQINTIDWNNDKEMVRGKSIEAKAINEHIDNARFRIKEKYRMLEDKGDLITAEIVRAAYLGVQAMQKGHKLLELLVYYKTIWDDKLKEGSLKNYRTTIQYVKLFIAKQYPAGDIFLSQLNMQFATDFEHYVRNNPIKDYDPCKGNGVSKHIQRLKRIMNWAVEIEWLKSHPFEKYSCPQKKSKRKKLTIQELVALQEQLLNNEKLSYVKDLFLFSCYTGLAYVDAIALTHTDFERSLDGTVWCKIYRTKSDGLSHVPLLKSAVDIMDKYKEHPNSILRGAIFPGITNQTINRELKILREVCGIATPMSFHVARHTFAKTVALKNGVPLETIQLMLGHTKISTTQIYADVDEEKIMDDMIGVEDRLGKKREIVLASKLLQKNR